MPNRVSRKLNKNSTQKEPFPRMAADPKLRELVRRLAAPRPQPVVYEKVWQDEPREHRSRARRAAIRRRIPGVATLLLEPSRNAECRAWK